VPAVTREPAHTSFASRPPPLAPLALPSAAVEDLLLGGQGPTGAPAGLPFAEELAWLVLLVEGCCYEDYGIEFASSASRGSIAGEEGTTEGEASVLSTGAWMPAMDVVPLGIPQVDALPADAAATKPWMALAVLFQGDGEWEHEAVICRLRHRMPASVSPHLANGSTSSPLVPTIAPPAHCAASCRWAAHIGCFGMLVRFCLGTAPADSASGSDALGIVAAINKAALAVGAAARSSSAGDSAVTQRHLIGHRFATHVQIRLRPTDSPSEAAGLDNDSQQNKLLAPMQLPSPRLRSRSLQLGPLPQNAADVSQSAAPLVWDAGDRYEIWLQTTDGLTLDCTYTVDIRVGTSARWSPWASVPGPILFTLPVPKPLPGRPGRDLKARLVVTMTSATTALLRFPAFLLAPGTATAEYRVTAVPELAEAAADRGEGEGQEEQELAPRTDEEGIEKAGPISKTFVLTRRAIRTDEEAVHSLVERGALQDLGDAQQLALLLRHETEEDLDAIYRAAEEDCIEVELDGLLPATRYAFTAAARHLGQPDVTPFSEALTEKVETPCGTAPPAAPVRAEAGRVASADIGPFDRVVLLEVEDRSEYVLECMGAAVETGLGWYPAEKPSGTAGEKKKETSTGETGRWWCTNAAVDAIGEWYAVPMRRTEATWTRPGFACVIADLTEFLVGVGSAPANAELPDKLWFRLRVAERKGSHPCRWVGSISEAAAACIAPIAVAPMPKRTFMSTSWHVSVSFFLNSTTRPQCVSVADVRQGGSLQSAFSNLIEAGNEPGKFEDDPASDDDFDSADVPAGYGHRQVTLMQARVRLVGASVGCNDPSLGQHLRALPRTWLMLPEALLSQCKAEAPSSLRGTIAAKVGNLHVFTLAGTEHLVEGGVYRVQVRIGDGYRWSAWSLSSRRFEYNVTQPHPVEGDLEVDTLSSNVARCRWTEFAVAPGVTEVEYELRADPTWSAGTLQGVRSAVSTHILPARYDNCVLEAELSNLLPATEYIFSVAARYPNIGWRSWGKALRTKPQALKDRVADWAAPPAPIILPHNGPRPFALLGGCPFFHPNERALLVGFPDTSNSADNVAYSLEYKHVGILDDGAECENLWPVDYRVSWKAPLEVACVDDIDSGSSQMIAALAAPWKVPPKLWRVRLSTIQMSAGDERNEWMNAQLQRVQLRLSAIARGDCPATRWFSAPSIPMCAAMAPPLHAKAALQISDIDLSICVKFALDLRYALDNLCAATGERSKTLGSEALQAIENSTECDDDEQLDQEADNDVEALPQLPCGFCHMFATRFQVRSRHSPRPPGSQPTDRTKKPPGLPWSQWAESPDADLKASDAESIGDAAPGMLQHSISLFLPGSASLEYGSWYQVSVRISDGTCWSDWSEPSSPVKVFVAPPKTERPDTDALSFEHGRGGNNIVLRWPLLRAHGGLRLIEYALFIREVLHDRSEICPRQIAAIIMGRAATSEKERMAPEDNEHMVFEARDLRQDVTYMFTLAARYPHIGPRDFEDTLNSAPTCLRATSSPLPIPMQLPLPPERLRRMHGMRCVLLKWSYAGLQTALAAKEVDDDVEKKDSERHYDIQALQEGATDDEWVLCKNVSRIKVDGVVAWFVKDLQGQVLRSRFRLWEKETGRFGRTSPLMLALVEPVAKLAAARVIGPSGALILLRAPLDAPYGSHEFVCRYQVRCRLEHLDSEWFELPIQIFWHRQNDHLTAVDAPVDSMGAVVSGLSTKDCANESGSKAVDVSAGDGAAPAPGEDSFRSMDAAKLAAKAPMFPTIPLATVGPLGDVTRQRCLLATVREEDGLDLCHSYVFSLRVGDLYRLSEWSEPSAPAKLGVPPPHLEPSLGTEDAQICVSEVTDSSLCATWPRFTPATRAGVPVHSEVEYLLTVAPQPPKRKLVGRGRQPEEAPQPHSQWFLTSEHPKGATANEVQQGKPLTVVVTGLVPYTPYELKLSVRYARLGSRKWGEALVVSATTKKADAEHRLLAVEKASSENAQDLAGARRTDQRNRKLAIPNEFGRLSEPDVRAYPKENGRPGLSAESPRCAESPRRLPPLDTPQQSQSGHASPPAGAEPPSAGVDFATGLLTSSDAEDWLTLAQVDTGRIIGGAGVSGGLGGGVSQYQQSGPSGDNIDSSMGAALGYPPRPPDFVPFWRRDPMDGRPAMPAMPAAPSHHGPLGGGGAGGGGGGGHGAGAGRGEEGPPLVPRPPASERVLGRPSRPPEERPASYPRRL